MLTSRAISGCLVGPVAIAMLALARDAHADPVLPTFVSVGPLASWVAYPAAAGAPSTFGIGGEISVHHFVYAPRLETGRNTPPWPAWLLGGVGVGAFAQAEYLPLARARVTAGVQATWTAVGLELGFLGESGRPEHAGMFAVHVAPFVSFGYLVVALRIAVPLVAIGPGTHDGVAVGLSVALKFPFNATPGTRWYSPF